MGVDRAAVGSLLRRGAARLDGEPDDAFPARGRELITLCDDYSGELVPALRAFPRD
ncbi:hypothetical protein ABZ614_29455 [Streptomyces sp. NPDC013178]|uniref:hypothetical protein n=1 Tax=Streptomyces sp. NPDC013178 TaxID=3155118 RepID=UPI0033D4DB6A